MTADVSDTVIHPGTHPWWWYTPSVPAHDCPGRRVYCPDCGQWIPRAAAPPQVVWGAAGSCSSAHA